jgi:hypothetical protein
MQGTTGSSLNSIQSQGLPGFKFGSSNLGAIISGFIPYIFVIAGLMLLLYIIAAGYGMMTSRGDPKALEGAKAKLTNALIGFVVIFTAFWIVQILGLVLGLSSINAIFGGAGVIPGSCGPTGC